MVADVANNKIYILAGSPYQGSSDYLWEFDRINDKWRIVAYFAATDETYQIATSDYNIFYVMATSKRDDINFIPVGTYDSSEASSTNPSRVKILKLDISTGVISTFIDGSNTYPPQLATFYDVGFPRPSAPSVRYGKLPDTRSGFTMHNDKLYYRYASSNMAGVAEADSDGNTSRFLPVISLTTDAPVFTAFCFCISGNELFLAYSGNNLILSLIHI